MIGFMYKVTVNNKIFFAKEGTLLSDIIISSGEVHSQPCGGMGKCKKCTVTVNGKKELSCQYKIHSDITVEFSSEQIFSPAVSTCISDIESDKTVLVLDIGTTTLALGIVDIKSKRLINVISDTNPQRVFGSDVMSRIDYCAKHGPESLNKILIDRINEMINSVKEYSFDTLFVAGNTTMLHLFFGVDCSSIGKAPYTPVFLGARTENGKSIGLDSIKTVHSLPSISSFVGADITAGLNITDFPENEKYSLLVDLGTNAEIVLFKKDRLICTSAAAGPCFEGVNITCGMSATDGAVCEYRSGSDYKTVNNKKAKGICATGLIDIIAVLLQNEIIDKSGFMESESFRINEDVFLTRADVRQFQNAKSAIFSGILTLLANEGIDFANIEALYVSGGFSEKLNIENAVRSGLFPNELKNKFIPLNNSSLLGTAKYAAENNELEYIIKNAVAVELAESPCFSELFIENMMF